MPFFPQEFLPEAAIMQLLAEIDQSQSSKSQPQLHHQLQRVQSQEHPCVRLVHRPQVQTFTPRFDVTETAGSYELYGELPGLQNADLDIQFVDAQTIVIKGKTERNVSAGAVASAIEKDVEQAQETATESDENEKISLSATVEDDYDEMDKPLDTPSSDASSSSSVTKGKQPETAAAPSHSSANTEAQPQRQARYWVSERKVGSFARSFTFEQRIEQDFVTAGLKNGILSVVVPKSVRSKRVTVSVL